MNLVWFDSWTFVSLFSLASWETDGQGISAQKTALPQQVQARDALEEGPLEERLHIVLLKELFLSSQLVRLPISSAFLG